MSLANEEEKRLKEDELSKQFGEIESTYSDEGLAKELGDSDKEVGGEQSVEMIKKEGILAQMRVF